MYPYYLVLVDRAVSVFGVLCLDTCGERVLAGGNNALSID